MSEQSSSADPNKVQKLMLVNASQQTSWRVFTTQMGSWWPLAQDLDTAPIEEPLRATLRMLKKLTTEHSVQAEDMRTMLASGVTHAQIMDALAVAFAFNTVARLAEAFRFEMPTSAAMDAGAKFLLARGYG